MNSEQTLPRLADNFFSDSERMLSEAARSMGVKISRQSLRVAMGEDVRIVSAVSSDLETSTLSAQLNQPILGVFYISGRLGGDISKPGIYTAKVVRDSNARQAVLLDREGNEVARGPLEIRRTDEINAQVTGFCCSQPEIGEGFACVGFTCCNSLSGCISHRYCFTI